MANKKICIGIPHVGMIPAFTHTSVQNLKMPQGYDIIYHYVGSCVVYDARENIINFARGKECDYVLFIDSDMVVQEDTILRMVKIFETSDAHLVSGMAFKRIPPFQPCWYTKASYDIKTFTPYQESPVEFPDEGIMQVEGVGMACCMIKMSLFDKIEKPYFFPLPNAGEDLSFCYKARKAKANMYVDLSINTGHVAQIPIYKEHFRMAYAEHIKNNDGKKIFE